MSNNEKIGDLLYKWENEFGECNAVINNELRIVFKKHLFFDALKPSDNYYEENLIKCQVCKLIVNILIIIIYYIYYIY